MRTCTSRRRLQAPGTRLETISHTKHASGPWLACYMKGNGIACPKRSKRMSRLVPARGAFFTAERRSQRVAFWMLLPSETVRMAWNPRRERASNAIHVQASSILNVQSNDLEQSCLQCCRSQHVEHCFSPCGT
eukprot:3296749-Amphidinium_carterae.1